MITKEIVLDRLDFDAEKGIFTWKRFMGGSAKAGSVAGSLDTKGYIQICIKKKLYLAHRLVWLITHGVWPDHHIDHIDMNPLNIKPSNLRKCSHSQNHQNTKVRSDSSSGVTGVSFSKLSGKWLAYINVSGKRYRLGLFECMDDAIKARVKAKEEMHLFHPKQDAKNQAIEWASRFGDKQRAAA